MFYFTQIGSLQPHETKISTIFFPIDYETIRSKWVKKYIFRRMTARLCKAKDHFGTIHKPPLVTIKRNGDNVSTAFTTKKHFLLPTH